MKNALNIFTNRFPVPGLHMKVLRVPPVVAGQHAVYVTVAVEGQGHGSASQQVTLDVLGPDAGTDSANVTITC